MKITIIGTVARTGAERTFAGGFRKREVVVLVGGDESRPLPVEFTAREGGADRIAQTLGIEPGALVRVVADLSGHEWEGRVFLSLRGVEIRAASFGEPPAPSEAPPGAALEDPPF